MIVTSLVTTLCDAVTDWTREAVELVYPPTCVACGTALPSELARQEPHAGLGMRAFCSACYEQLRCRVDRSCQSCGAPVGPHLPTRNCRHCRNDRFAFDRVVALGVYQESLQNCCQRAKESFGRPIAAGLTGLLWDAHGPALRAANIDVVIPIPHHWWDRATGGVQPPVTIGRVLARQLSIPMATHILAKRRRTPAQSSLPPARRRTNLRNAFELVGRQQLGGLSVLLTDDILTTGTTANRAAHLLKEAGVARIFVAVLARGLGQHANR